MWSTTRNVFAVAIAMVTAAHGQPLVAAVDDNARVYVAPWGGAAFDPLVVLDRMPGASSRGAATGDFDGDGFTDIVAGAIVTSVA